MNLEKLTIAELGRLYRERRVSAVEAVAAYFKAIRAKDGLLHAYLSVNESAALAQAEAVDRDRAAGAELPPLAGIPLAIKDNICLRGERTTCASRILENFVSPYDATVIERLRGQRAIFLGKTNLDEFAFGSSTENSAFGVTRNPANPEYVSGGSSGGSAAAVAAGLAAAALGSDTGGSIRQPASFCGVVGLKPTYGRVSRYGLVAFASSFDQIGPLTRSVEDAAVILGAIAGPDPLDSTSVEAPVADYPAGLEAPVSGLRIGLPREYFGAGLDPGVAEGVERGVKILEKLGASVREVSLPHTASAIAVYYVLAPAEASANLARFDGVRYGRRMPEGATMRDLYELSRDAGFGKEVKRRIIMGTFVLSSGYYDAYYLQAQKVRTLIRQDFESAFKEVDLLVTPTAPGPAFRIGSKVTDPLTMYLSDVFTVSCNLAGLPGLNLPVGRTAGNLPVGLQLLGPVFSEELVLRAARALERELGGPGAV
ncbi:MAG TPA: Asp-tRNA(Asn)/Glu-tRNA(Gln) amidotransferase subunit GatA [bacterium]|nr:Asp-tRNA(Asn)/Glu-tRNA(Gln) amidotransferase subunit GatA [bacterium]HNS47999.1 Asp-tRNA(Asn)/Glu-tRNA(Gln) amidotransferase subunit GatA [bacterium]